RMVQSPPLPLSEGTRRGMLILERPLAFLDLEDLDHVADLDIVETVQPDTAFETGADFGHVVLEPAQRRDAALVDDDIVAHETRPEVAADMAFGDQTAGGLAELARLEHVADLGAADDILHALRTQLARHGG